MRLTLFLSTFFFVTTFSLAQNTFSKVHYLQSGNLKGFSFTRCVNGQFLLVGKALQNQGQFTYLDTGGNHLQTVVLNANAQAGDALVLRNVHALNDSTHLLSGNCFNIVSGNNEIFAVSITENGDTLFTSTYANPSEQYNYSVTGSIRTWNNHSLLLASPALFTTDMYLLEIDDAGQVIWSKKYSAPQELQASCISVAEDSTYYICGQIGADGFWMHLDNDGDVLWTRQSAYIIPDKLLLSDEGIFLSGSTNQQSAAIARSDYNGDLLYTNILSGSLIYENQTMIVPYTDSSYIFLSGHPYESTLAVIDSALHVSTIKRLYINFADILRDTDNQFVVLGNGPLWGLRSSDVFLDHVGIMKLDTALNAHEMQCSFDGSESETTFPLTTTTFSCTTVNGNMQAYHPEVTLSTTPPFSYNGCVSSFGGVDETSRVFVSLYPTISDGWVNLYSEENQTVDVIVYDAAGNLLKQAFVNYGKSAIDLSSMESGMYFFQLRTQEGRTMTRRVILL